MKLPAKKGCHTTLKSTYATTLIIFTTARDLARLLLDSSAPLPPNFHPTPWPEGKYKMSKNIELFEKLITLGFCLTLVSLIPETIPLILSASMTNPGFNSAVTTRLLTLKLSLVSTLASHHTKPEKSL